MGDIRKKSSGLSWVCGLRSNMTWNNDWSELVPELDGQTSINDYLSPTAAIVPVAVRAPTDEELAAFLSDHAG